MNFVFAYADCWFFEFAEAHFLLIFLYKHYCRSDIRITLKAESLILHCRNGCRQKIEILNLESSRIVRACTIFNNAKFSFMYTVRSKYWNNNNYY